MSGSRTTTTTRSAVRRTAEATQKGIAGGVDGLLGSVSVGRVAGCPKYQAGDGPQLNGARTIARKHVDALGSPRNRYRHESCLREPQA